MKTSLHYSNPTQNLLSLGRKAFPGRLLAVLTMLLALNALVPGISQSALAQQVESAPAVQTVNINKADAQTLAAALNGVGPSRAEEIIRYREAYGPFESVDELVEVKGIGQATLDKNRELITLE